MVLQSRETLYRSRSTFQGVDNHECIPSFGFKKPIDVDGFTTTDGQEIYFGCASGVYSESPKKTPFKHGVSWDAVTNVLGVYFAVPSKTFCGLRLGGTVQNPVKRTFETTRPINGILVESFKNRTAIHPSQFYFINEEVQIEPITGGEEVEGPDVDRLVFEHIDVIVNKILKKTPENLHKQT